MRRLQHVWLHFSLLLLAALVLAACGESGGDRSAGSDVPENVDADPVHVHGLGINPSDGALFIATHTGLFRAAEGETEAQPVGDSLQDTMGFTVVGPDRFLGSGHPGPGEAGPPLLGLIASEDAGRAWSPVSLSGEADFHVLRSAHGHVYGFDGANGRLMVSDDEGRTWAEREPPGSLIDLAVDPDDPQRIVAAGQAGLAVSSDDGESWRPLGRELGLLTWPAADRLYLVDGDGAVHVSADSGASWKAVGELGGQPAALVSRGVSELYAALPDGTVKQSTDGGASWTVRSTP